MSIVVTAEEEILVGRKVVVEGPAPDSPFTVLFEDDGTSGYFYAWDVEAERNSIQDAVHIYNVNDVTDRDRPAVVKIGLSQDGQKTVLLINGYPHAVFDFSARRGYCRTGFPPPPSNGVWSVAGHQWDDSVIELLR
ncbi:DUF2251 domain-containing protein [Massilia sp. TW-1]|uniref:DUF2251 domain-containing protein n=1 Tax=Telluria antibiotica TaxID=2717319 RepID=A0ABX0PGH8_9BURK|nr:DUF2251 domain-containing protein [Telluria antibiotica]NIA56371.1 DUF2251 domain-containing protein [Telluria antibiotica]